MTKKQENGSQPMNLQKDFIMVKTLRDRDRLNTSTMWVIVLAQITQQAHTENGT